MDRPTLEGLMASIRHTLMTGLAHNAAIHALNDLAERLCAPSASAAVPEGWTQASINASHLINELEYAVLSRANGLPGSSEKLSAAKQAVRAALLAAAPSAPVGEPALLFDGYYVWNEGLTDDARKRTSPENVADVLDAVVRLMRGEGMTSQQKEKQG